MKELPFPEYNPSEVCRRIIALCDAVQDKPVRICKMVSIREVMESIHIDSK